jgi:PAS domain S-box-containing protein
MSKPEADPPGLAAPEGFEAVKALLELARAFAPDFQLPQLASEPPIASKVTSIEKRMRTAEAQYQALVEQIPAVTFMASFENGLSRIYVSPHIETLLGYTAKEWIEDPILWYQRLHPDDKQRWNIEFSRTVSWAEPFKADYRFLAKDGRVVWIHGEAKVVRDESGRPSFVQGIGYDITERKRFEEQIQASLREKEVLLKEIHHRVKNNLQVTSSLLKLQSDHIRDPQAQEMFADSQNRIRSMALVHEKLYQTSDLSRINFVDYSASLAALLFRSYGIDDKQISLHIEGSGIFLSVESAVPCGLIVNELLSNCLKHAFPHGRRGNIQIRIGREGSRQLTLEVADNGVGLPPALDLEKTDTLGLQLVWNLAEQLDGTIHVERQEGAAFKIAFPEAGT